MTAKEKRQLRVKEFVDRYMNDDALVFHHKLLVPGSMPRHKPGTVTEYSGKFGDGYVLDVPYWSENGTNWNHERYYFIKKGGKTQ